MKAEKSTKSSAVCNLQRAISDLMRKMTLVKDGRPFTLPVILLLFPTLAVLLAVVGFYLGKPLTKWYGVMSLFVCVTLLCGGATSKREAFKSSLIYFAILVALCCSSSLFFLAYFSDAVAYHSPGSILLSDGWNPLFESRFEQLLSGMVDLDKMRSVMVEYMPKQAWIFGGIMYLITGTTVSFAISSLILMVCLGMVLYRFGNIFLSKSTFLRWGLIAFVICSPTLLYAAWMLADYLLYSAILITTLSFVMYIDKKKSEDAIMFILSTIWLVNAKVSGLLFGAVVLSALVLVAFGKYILREYSPNMFNNSFAVIVIAGSLAFFSGSTPYLTNWVNHGSPAYPEHSLNPNKEAETVVAYYTPDAEGEKVGYLGRVMHAWFSKDIAMQYYKAKLRDKNFSPKFHLYTHPMHGYGRAFGFLMCLSLFCLLLSKRSLVDLAIFIVFLSAVAIPTRFIGAPRYVPQMWAVPFMALINFMANPGDFVKTLSAKFGRFVCLGVNTFFWTCMLVAGGISLAWVGFQTMRTLSISVEQMRSYQEMKVWPEVECLMASVRDTNGVKVFSDESLTLCKRPEAFYYENAFSEMGLKEVKFLYEGTIDRSEKIGKNQCILFPDQGYILTSNSAEEYERWFSDSCLWNIESVNRLKTANVFTVLTSIPNYFFALTKLRMKQMYGVWFNRKED